MSDFKTLLSTTECLLDPELDTVAISYTEFKMGVEALEYASPERVMLLMLAYTGCRVAELDHMYAHNLQGNTISWRCGKNQHKMWRKETLPDCFLIELSQYRLNHRSYEQRLFGVDHRTWRRMLNKKRAHIGGVWNERSGLTLNCSYKQAAYKIQPRALRKVFQTILFKYYREKYGCSDTAMLRVSKRMRHSSKGITAEFYIENAEAIEPERWIEHFFNRKPIYESQKLLWEF